MIDQLILACRAQPGVVQDVKHLAATIVIRTLKVSKRPGPWSVPDIVPSRVASVAVYQLKTEARRVRIVHIMDVAFHVFIGMGKMAPDAGQISTRSFRFCKKRQSR